MTNAGSTMRWRPPTPTPTATLLDWLSLVEPDGAFLTPAVLKETFPHGFEPLPAELRNELKSHVEDLGDDPVERAALRGWLLRVLLGWEDQYVEGQQIPATAAVMVAQHSVTLRPQGVLVDVDDPNRTRLGVFAWRVGTLLDRRPDPLVTGDLWSASPAQRAEKWCREANIPLALVTDDDQWLLVWEPRGGTTATCRFRISDLADERILQAGFVSLLGSRRFFAVPDVPKTGETLERLFERSGDAELEITKGLGRQVRRCVELLVSAMSREHVASGRRLLASVADDEVYEAAVTVLMRLVFLLYAEERRLLPSEDPLWSESYSVLTLREQLRLTAHRDGEDTLERRSSAWHRLLATFRGVHGGVHHDRLRLPAYGGALFDPQRFNFL
ncbi:MAG: restriction endonuclease, partial [Acidimicrobiales bacterium]